MYGKHYTYLIERMHKMTLLRMICKNDVEHSL